MSVSDGFSRHVLDQLALLGPVELRRMFGGAGLYLEGRMFALIAEDELFLKTDNRNRPRHEAAGCRPFRPFPDQPMRMPYWSVPADVFDDRERLAEWARAAVEASLRSPAKRTRQRPGGRRSSRAG